MDHRKAERVAFQTVFRTPGVSANLRLEIEDLFYRCSVQEQNSAATSIVKNSVAYKSSSRHSHMSNG
jgi:hypothetical protein